MVFYCRHVISSISSIFETVLGVEQIARLSSKLSSRSLELTTSRKSVAKRTNRTCFIKCAPEGCIIEKQIHLLLQLLLFLLLLLSQSALLAIAACPPALHSAHQAHTTRETLVNATTVQLAGLLKQELQTARS